MKTNRKKYTWLTMAAGVVILALFVTGGCKKSSEEIKSIILDIAQSAWDLSQTNGSEEVEVFLVGEDVEKIVLDDIEMRGDNTSAGTLKADSTSLQGDRVKAEFSKSGVLGLLDDPSSGSSHRITILFYMTDREHRMEASATVTISGTDALTLEIDPAEWSLNYDRSSGTVEAFIRGEGIENIDLSTIEMMGDNPAAEALPASSATLQGNHIHARFPKNVILGLLSDPVEGSVHTITVSFLETGGTEPQQLSAMVSIEDDDGIEPTELELDIEPEEWSLNFGNSSGTVEAFIRGEGIENIDLSTIEMMGDNPAAEALPASSAVLQGNHIHARFPKNMVLDLLLNPAAGTTHTIIVSFLETGGSERVELSTEIVIEDEDGIEPSELELDVEPEEWSMNYNNSSGSVEAFIRGEGIENIDLDSIEMMGDNPSALPLPAESASLQGNHIHARFAKNQVLDLLLNPAGGTTHTITVSFLAIGGTERIELTAVITIEEDDDEEEPSELSLELSPDVWNLNYTGSSGTVSAFIRGDGFENIDIDSIELTGDNPSAEALLADSASRQGNHVRARFAKNQVLDLLLNPTSGTTHTVTVSFLEEGGSQRRELNAQVTITGN